MMSLNGVPGGSPASDGGFRPGPQWPGGAFATACAALLMGVTCSTQAAPANAECPRLAGTYAVGQTTWIDLLHLPATGRGRPRGQSPQRLSFQPKGEGYVMIWHMPRPAVHGAARRLADGDPRRYGVWLDRALQDSPPQTPVNGGDEVWFNELASLGPVFRVDVDLRFRACERGWFLLGSLGRTGPPDVAGGMAGDREAQLWLQRSPDGALAMRWRERRKVVMIERSRYSTEVAVPLWATDLVQHWSAAPNSDLSPLRGDELPARNPLPKCRKDIHRETAFFDRMDAALPPGARHVNRARGSEQQGRMLANGQCEPMPYWVTVDVARQEDLTVVEAFLKSDPFLSGLERREVDPDANGRLTARYRMTLLP